MGSGEHAAGNVTPSWYDMRVAKKTYITEIPEIMQYWDEANEKDPSTITKGSQKIYSWVCPLGHQDDVQVKNMVRRKDKCNYCSGVEILPGFNDLATTHPDLMKEVSPNNTIDMFTVCQGRTNRVLWMCLRGHEWEAPPSNRIKGHGCPYCAGHLAIPGETDILTTHPEICKELSPNNTADLTKIKHGSNVELTWICKRKHEWDAFPSTRLAGNGCPYCAGYLVMPGETDIATLFPGIAAEWSPNNTMNIENVGKGAGFKALWICPEGHEYPATVALRTGQNTGCSICCNLLIVKGINDLATTHPDLAKEWHPDNPCGPDEIPGGHSKRMLWICPKGHEFGTTPANRTSQNTGCKKCKEKFYKAEKVLYQALKNAETCYTISDRAQNEHGTDIEVIADNGTKIAVELDGIYWHGFQHSEGRDNRKTEKLLTYYDQVIRIRNIKLPLIPKATIITHKWELAESNKDVWTETIVNAIIKEIEKKGKN